MSDTSITVIYHAKYLWLYCILCVALSKVSENNCEMKTTYRVISN